MNNKMGCNTSATTLDECTIDNVDDIIYTFTKAKVIKVYDGDTITIAAWFNGAFIKFNVRLYGIDCAEIRGGTDESKLLANRAKQFVIDRLLNKIVDINVLNNKILNDKKVQEKYGRLLAIVSIDGMSIADELIREGLAKSYFGGTK